MMLTKSDFWPPLIGGWNTFSGVLVRADEVIAAFVKAGILGRPEDRPDPDSDEDDFLSYVCDLASDYDVPAPAEVFVYPDGNRFRGFNPPRPGIYLYWSEHDWAASTRLRELFSEHSPLNFSYRRRLFIPVGADMVFAVVAAVLVIGVIWVLGCK